MHTRLLLSAQRRRQFTPAVHSTTSIRWTHRSSSWCASALPFGPLHTSMCNRANAVILQLDWLTFASVELCGVYGKRTVHIRQLPPVAPALVDMFAWLRPLARTVCLAPVMELPYTSLLCSWCPDLSPALPQQHRHTADQWHPVTPPSQRSSPERQAICSANSS